MPAPSSGRTRSSRLRWGQRQRPLLAFALGGPLLLGFISAVAFATILAVVAGLTITAAASFAHDIYANVVKKGDVPPDGEVKVARRTVIVIGVLAILGASRPGTERGLPRRPRLRGRGLANLPTILFSLFWRKFTTRGAVWSMYGGLGSALVLIFLSPVFWGTPTSVFADTGVAVWPLNNPGIVSIPLGSSWAGWLGHLAHGRGPPQGGRDGRAIPHRLRRREGVEPLTRPRPSRSGGAGRRRAEPSCHPPARSPIIAPRRPASPRGAEPLAEQHPALEVEQVLLHLGMAAVLADGPVGAHDPMHGTTIENGLEAHAVPTARAARGASAISATSPYERPRRRGSRRSPRALRA